MTLTPQQLAAVESITSGTPTECQAVAGSGKTHTIRSALQKHCFPGTLLLAFNVSIKKALEAAAPPDCTVLTMNGLGHRALSKLMGRRLEVKSDKTFINLSGLADQYELTRGDFGEVLDIVGKAESAGLMPVSVAGGRKDDQSAWTDLCDAHDLDHSLIPVAIAVQSKSIQQALSGTINFNEQVYLPLRLGASFPHYPHVIVDESQDLSPLNHQQIVRVKPRQVVAVGDPNQAIYGFRGASFTSMQQLTELFQLKPVRLSVCFRCPQSVIERAQHYVPDITAAPGAIEGSVTELASWHEIATPSTVLCRFNAPLFALFFKLWADNKPARFSNTKDLLATFKRICKKVGMHLAMPAFMSGLQRWADEKPSKRADQATALTTIIENLQPSDPDNLLRKLEAMLESAGGSVLLSTIHKAKGLEWDRVVWLNPGVRPRDCDEAQEQQEDNLCYVAITRAQRELQLVHFEH